MTDDTQWHVDDEPDRPLSRWETLSTLSIYGVAYLGAALAVLLVLWGVWLIGDYAWREMW